jgi:ATP-dependent DNA helicase RecQ
MLLSCIYRMQQASPNANFAAGHTIDVLRGNLSVSVERFRHNAISTFGIGTELSEAQWRSVLRRLVGVGMVAVDAGHHNALTVLEAGSAFLRSKTPSAFKLRQIAAADRERSPRSRKTGSSSSSVSSGSSYERDSAPRTQSERIFHNLKTWRAAIAKEHGMPAYAIFQDVTLKAIAQSAPQSLDDLGGITGVGARKLVSYGSPILSIVASQLD